MKIFRNGLFIYVSAIFMLCQILSCKSNPNDSWEENSLFKYNIPLYIRLPDSVEFKYLDFGISKDLSVLGPGNFHLQILASDALNSNLKKTIADNKINIRSHPYFSKFIEEYDDGFIFEKKIDTAYTTYDFRHFKIAGNTEIVFQMGLLGQFSEDEARRMYKLCTEAK